MVIESRIPDGKASASACRGRVVDHRTLAHWLPACGGVVLGASLFIFVMALKPFAFGVWYQSEPVAAALFAAGASSALCLAFMTAFGFPVAAALRHPIVLVTGGLALWSALAAPLAPLPMRSFFGAPETGEGVLWYLTLAIQTALALLLWPLLRVRRLLVWASVLAGIAILALNIPFPIHSPWRPAVWPEFAAYLGLFLIAVLASGSSIRWPGPVSRLLGRIPVIGRMLADPATIRVSAALIIGGAVVVTSLNKTAIALAAAILPAAMLAGWLTGRRLFRALAVIAALLAPAGIVTGMYWLGVHKQLESPLSRTDMSRLIATVLIDQPRLLIHGAGWGAFNDTLFGNAHLVRDVNLRTETWQQSLEHNGGGAFHSHNGFLEATLSAGLPGGLLYLAIPLTAILYARRRHAGTLAGVWIAVSGLSAAWFVLPLAVPFQALALAATVGGTPSLRPVPPRFTPTPRRFLAGTAVLCSAIILATGSVLTIQTALRGDRLLKAVVSTAPIMPNAHEHLLFDNGRGGAHLWWVSLDYMFRLKKKAEAGRPLTADEVKWCDIVLRAVDWHVANQPASLRLKSMRVIIRDTIAMSLGDPQIDPLRKREVPVWGKVILDLLDEAPHRSDIAIPYMTLLLETGNGAVAYRFGNEILLRDPDDPIGLWFSGLPMLPQPQWSRLGLARLIRAMDTGVDRFMPIPDEMRDMLNAERDKNL